MERRIILVDDHSLFRNGLRGLLERCAECRVVGEAASGEEFLAMLDDIDADIVFMDFSMPGLDGAQTTERALARRPDLRIITLSMFGEESYYSRMVEAGARGFLLKDSDIGDVIDAIETVTGGGSYFSPQLLTSLTGRMRTREDAADEQLSSREREILVAVCRGCRIRRSPTNSSSRSARWTSTAPISSKRPAARIPLRWWSTPSATASSIFRFRFSRAFFAHLLRGRDSRMLRLCSCPLHEARNLRRDNQNPASQAGYSSGEKTRMSDSAQRRGRGRLNHSPGVRAWQRVASSRNTASIRAVNSVS